MRRYGVVAVLVSLSLHGCLVALLSSSESARDIRPNDVVSSTLAGTTFEVDMTPLQGASNPAGASAPSAPPQAAPPASSVASAATSEQPEVSVGLSEFPTGASKPPPAPAEPRRKPRPAVPSAPGPSSLAHSEPREAQSTEERSGEAQSNIGQAGAARYGAAEGATRVSLMRAFIKTLPLAAKLFPGWLELELGAQKPVLVELRLNPEGHLAAIEIVGGDARRLTAQSVQRNQVFLGSARFANEAKVPLALLFSVRAEVSMRPASEELDSAEKVVALGQRFDAARPSEPPTGAYLTYGSGRHIEFEVSLVEAAH